MSGERDYMHEPSIAEMGKAMADAVGKGEEFEANLNAVMKKLESGALVGDGGDSFLNAIRECKLHWVRLKDNLLELGGDLTQVIATMREAEERARGRF